MTPKSDEFEFFAKYIIWTTTYRLEEEMSGNERKITAVF
jgi:hypothetical protein